MHPETWGCLEKSPKLLDELHKWIQDLWVQGKE